MEQALLLHRLEDEIELRLRSGMDIRTIGPEWRATIDSISCACGHNKLRLKQVEAHDLPDGVASTVRNEIIDSLRAPMREIYPVLSAIPITQIIEQAASGRVAPAEVRVDAFTSRRAFLTGDDIRAFIHTQITRANIRMVDALDQQRTMIEEQRQMLRRQQLTIDQISASHAALQAQVAASRRWKFGVRFRRSFVGRKLEGG